jgi:beta-glucanase (GH16 family)
MRKNRLVTRHPRTAWRFYFWRTGAAVMRSVCVVTIAVFVFAIETNAQVWGDPVWSDEFNSSVPGTAPDASNWTFEVGGGGWGNHELEIYCATGSATPAPCDAKHPNAFQDGTGHLIIRASRVSRDPAPTGTWTSARLKTAGLKDFRYGRMESCMKLPVGAGLWPAFWMLGTTELWPAGGEIDIMENIPATGGSGGGLGPMKIESTIHGPSSSQKGIYSLTQVYVLPGQQRIDDTNPACHVYGVIWSPFMVQMYVDDWRKPFFIRTASDVPREGRWVFDAPFYFLLNLAVGGDWPGPPDRATPSPSEMLVDYVRVYKPARVEGPKMTASPLTLQPDATATSILQMTAASGSGYVYLSCSTDTAKATCAVDTGNPRNVSVADFSSSGLQIATITVRAVRASVKRDAAGAKFSVTITAYTVNGEESNLLVPVE